MQQSAPGVGGASGSTSGSEVVVYTDELTGAAAAIPAFEVAARADSERISRETENAIHNDIMTISVKDVDWDASPVGEASTIERAYGLRELTAGTISIDVGG